MSIQVIKALLECKTIASINRVVGDNYDCNDMDIQINNIRLKTLSNECKKYDLKLLIDENEIIENSYLKHNFNENQKAIFNLLWENGHSVAPIIGERATVDELIKMIKESKGDNLDEIKNYAIKLESIKNCK